MRTILLILLPLSFALLNLELLIFDWYVHWGILFGAGSLVAFIGLHKKKPKKPRQFDGWYSGGDEKK